MYKKNRCIIINIFMNGMNGNRKPIAASDTQLRARFGNPLFFLCIRNVRAGDVTCSGGDIACVHIVAQCSRSRPPRSAQSCDWSTESVANRPMGRRVAPT